MPGLFVLATHYSRRQAETGAKLLEALLAGERRQEAAERDRVAHAEEHRADAAADGGVCAKQERQSEGGDGPGAAVEPLGLGGVGGLALGKRLPLHHQKRDPARHEQDVEGYAEG